MSIFYVGENSVVKRHEIRWWKKTISEAAEFILEKQDELGFKIKMLAIPHDMAKEGEIYRNTKGEVLGITKEKVLRKFGIPTLVTRASRIDGWDMLHDLMSLRREDDEKPVYRVHKSCIITMNGYETIAKDNNKKGDIKEGQEDHFPDSDRYFAVMYNTFIHPKRKEERKQKSFREQVQERAIAKRTTIRKYNAYSSR